MIGKRKCTKCNSKVQYINTFGIYKYSTYICKGCGSELILASPESLYWGFLGMLPMLLGVLYGLSGTAVSLLGVLGVGCYYYVIPLKVSNSDT